MKALRFLGIALLACGMMFVSCKKEETKTNTTVTPEPPAPTGPITVTFDGETWLPENIQSNEYVNYQGTDYCAFDLYKTNGSYFPSTDGIVILNNQTPQSMPINYYKEKGYIVYTNQEHTDSLITGDYAWLGSQYNDPMTFSNCTFDATSLVTSFTLTAPLIGIAERFGSSQQTVVKNLTIKYTNVTLNGSTAKSFTNMKLNQPVVAIAEVKK